METGQRARLLCLVVPYLNATQCCCEKTSHNLGRYAGKKLWTVAEASG